MDELLAQFLVEGPELVQRGSDALMELERRPGDRLLMDEAFRAVHTLKGSVGLFDLPAMAATLHAAEDAMSAVRAGARAADAATVDGLLAILSQVERWLTLLGRVGELPPEAAAQGRVLASQLNGPAGRGEAAAARAGEWQAPPWARLVAGLAGSAASGRVAISYRPHAGCYFAGDDPVAILSGVPGLQSVWLDLAPAANPAGLYDPFECRLAMLAVAAAPEDAVRAALRLVIDQVETAALPAGAGAGSGGMAGADLADLPGAAPPDDAQAALRTLRVDAASVAALAALVDELVVARTSLGDVAARAAGGAEARALAGDLAALHGTMDRLIGQTHRQVMRLRMIPVAPLLRRFPRVVRTMAKAVEKDIDLVAEDNGVEADKTVIDGLFEPLTHLLRNAVDHGVEDAAARRAAGKPRRATILLSAHAEDARFTLSVRDDGAGIDAGAIRAAVIARGLRTPGEVAALSDDEAVELVFLPGFSTARAVTDLSGRGVGMDAVRRAVQGLGGRLSISTTLGVGTTVSLTVPLSLTLTKVIVVRSGGEAYGMPMDRVLETLKLPEAAVAPIRAGRAFNWRDRTVPLLPLAGLVLAGGPPCDVGTAGGAAAPTGQAAGGGVKVLVVRCAAGLLGIGVDAIQDRADVAVRPLEGLLAGLPCVAGTTLMGDGSVLMILDPDMLAA